MKKYKVIPAILVIVSILCSSCSVFSKNRISTNNFSNMLKNEGYELVEIDDLIDGCEDFYQGHNIDRDIETGAYAMADDKNDIKDVFRDSNGGTNFVALWGEYDKSMQSLCWYVQCQNERTTGYMVNIVSIEFDSEDSAEAYFGDLDDKLNHDDIEYDDGEEEGINYLIAKLDNSDDHTSYYGAYQCGEYVLVITGAEIGSSKAIREIAEICERLDLSSPDEL